MPFGERDRWAQRDGMGSGEFSRAGKLIPRHLFRGLVHKSGIIIVTWDGFGDLGTFLVGLTFFPGLDPMTWVSKWTLLAPFVYVRVIDGTLSDKNRKSQTSLE